MPDERVRQLSATISDRENDKLGHIVSGTLNGGT